MQKRRTSETFFRRQNAKADLDYYPTPPAATRALLRRIGDVSGQTCWEPAAGGGHMVSELRKAFRLVLASDVTDRGATGYVNLGSFLDARLRGVDWIITNPPFNLAREFTEHALSQAPHVAMLGRLMFLESAARYSLFTKRPPRVLVFSSRVHMVKGRLPTDEDGGPTMPYAWFVWGCGRPGSIEWIAPQESKD